jgi:TPR repeat protein
MYICGEGGEKDIALGLKLWKLASTGGVLEATNNLSKYLHMVSSNTSVPNISSKFDSPL